MKQHMDTQKLNHGEAVLLGINSATEFSFKKILKSNDYFKIKNHIHNINKSLKLNNYFKKKRRCENINFYENG